MPINRFANMRGLVLVILAMLSATSAAGAELGRFDTDTDLFLAHFDSKTDVDDIHSVAGVATMLADPRFSAVNYHAVAGAYGMQEGLYVPADELFERTFGDSWSDAHADFDTALEEVATLAAGTLAAGGAVWIAEAGQSDFSAALVRRLEKDLPGVNAKQRIHIVQHADWNEAVTRPADLAFVKAATSYHRIPDGNAVGNGSPGFRSDEVIDWRSWISDERLVEIWTMAIDIANTYNGVDGRYLNESIEKGGLDFSDVAESMWIFGFEDIVDARDFFRTFAD
ncbi:MAG: hypothetical protein V2I25_00230 [Woeseiaceae bacterium]|jgi:hypothetical protein|nr:hypothetical protein [Woeseiaceae bacterium]